MPELPEVETIKNDLKSEILGLKFKRVVVKENKSVRPNAKQFIDSLEDSKIVGIDRVGKLLIFELKGKPSAPGCTWSQSANGSLSKKSGQIEQSQLASRLQAQPGSDSKFYLLIHLKMTGQLIYCGKDLVLAGGHSDKKDVVNLMSQTGSFCLPSKHTRLQFTFSDGSILFFNDIRKFGYAQLADQNEVEKIKSRYGLDTLGKDLTAKNIGEILRKKTTTIKAALLNQELFAGIGNIYADEILFESRIRPTRIASSLSESELKILAISIKRILLKAIKFRGTTFSNYVDGQGNKGNFTRLLKVYGRGGQKCLRCGKTLVKSRVAQRGTVYCEYCQK